MNIKRSPKQQKLFNQLWRAFVILPVIPWILRLVLVLIFWFCASTHALAQGVGFDENLPYQHYHDNYIKSYCLFIYDVIGPNDDIYTCKQIRVHPIAPTGSNGYSASIAGRHNCWQYHYGGWYAYGGNQGGLEGIIISSKLEHSLSPPPYTPASPCIKKSDSDPPLSCNINITSIINGAFSNKFPLDLFTGFNSNTPPITACPSFTIENQTFQLCYINKLTATLKYVLLLAFIISSVLAL